MKKCPYCGKKYPDNVERCLTDNELLSGGESEAVPEAIIPKTVKSQPTKTNGKIGKFISLGLGILCLWLTLRSLIFDATCQATEGILDADYTQTTRGFISSYTVFYTYEANGVSYHESDSISHKPLIQTVPVYYNPSNPQESSLERGQWILFSIGTLLFGGGFLISFQRSKNKLVKLTDETKSEHWKN